MLMIFINHCWVILPFHIPDLGARGVELFFLLSGLLLTYNYYEHDFSCSFIKNIKFGVTRIRKFYLLHIITFILCLIQQINDSIALDKPIIMMLPKALLNILLLQSWIPLEEYYWGFNGVSWFLSSLLFCYILFPVMLRLIRKIRFIGSYVILLCTLLLVMNFFQTIYINMGGWKPDYVFHICPIYKSTEFFAGCLIGVICKEKIDEIKQRYCRNSFPTYFILIFYFSAVILCNTLWLRAMFVAIAALLLFVLACENGGLSRLFSCSMIRRIGAFSFEFYLIHHVVIVFYSRYGWSLPRPVNAGWIYDFGLMFIISIILSLLYQSGMTCLRTKQQMNVKPE